MPFCTQCGQENPSGSNFCSRCGAPLERADIADDATVTTSPVATGSSHDSGDTTKTIPVVPAGDDEAPTPGSAEDEVIQDLAAKTAVLFVRRGESDASKYVIAADSVVAGRSPASDIFLDDITVSRKHVVLERSPEGIVVRDVGSLNGTYVNRKLIEGPTLLHTGDELQIGKFRLAYYPSPHGFS